MGFIGSALGGLGGIGGVSNSSGSNWSSSNSITSAQGMMDYNYQMMLNQQAFNAEEARKAREWSEHMASTAYQRTVKDLLAAGLNPILATGNGATGVPTGVAASSAMASGAPDSISSSQSYGSHSAQTYNRMWDILGDSIAAFGNTVGSAVGLLGKDAASSGPVKDYDGSPKRRRPSFALHD